MIIWGKGKSREKLNEDFRLKNKSISHKEQDFKGKYNNLLPLSHPFGVHKKLAHYCPTILVKPHILTKIETTS